MNPPPGTRTPAVREAVDAGQLPRLVVRWPDTDLVAGITTRALNFGRHTEAPARDVADAHRRLRDWCAGRFEGVIGSSQIHATRLFQADGLAVPEDGSRAGPFSLRVAGYDGFLTATPGLLLTIGVADCVPAFLFAPAARAVALLHAGWRGVAGSIVPVGLAAMGRVYGVDPADCQAYWGPAIGPCCYPVGPEVVAAIGATAAGERRADWLRHSNGASYVDLRAALTVQAESHGVPATAITASGDCTACRRDRFHSYRREHGGGGRMLAVAGLPLASTPGASR